MFIRKKNVYILFYVIFFFPFEMNKETKIPFREQYLAIMGSSTSQQSRFAVHNQTYLFIVYTTVSIQDVFISDFLFGQICSACIAAIILNESFPSVVEQSPERFLVGRSVDVHGAGV